jgi:hypothetical protein
LSQIYFVAIYYQQRVQIGTLFAYYQYLGSFFGQNLSIWPPGVTIYRVTPYCLAINFEQIPSCFVLNYYVVTLHYQMVPIGMFLHNTNIWGNFFVKIWEFDPPGWPYLWLYGSTHKNNTRNGLVDAQNSQNELLHETLCRLVENFEIFINPRWLPHDFDLFDLENGSRSNVI